MAITGVMQRWQGKVLGVFVGIKGTFSLLPSVVTALGSNSQANSLLIKRPVTIVTVASVSTRGVRLPLPFDTVNGGDTRIVLNATAGSVLVYPNSGAAIGSGSANQATTMVAGKAYMFIAQSGTQWRYLKGA